MYDRVTVIESFGEAPEIVNGPEPLTARVFPGVVLSTAVAVQEVLEALSPTVPPVGAGVPELSAAVVHLYLLYQMQQLCYWQMLFG